jgi:hypothetical protein
MTCASQTNCGWQQTGNTGICLPGTAGGPADVVTTSNDYWYWNTSDCQLSYAMGKLPPGPTCVGNAPLAGHGGSMGGGGAPHAGSGTTGEEYVCDVTLTYPEGSGRSPSTAPDYGCNTDGSDEATLTYDQQCVFRLSHGDAATCTVTNCHATGVPYVCPCAPSDPRSYCH